MSDERKSDKKKELSSFSDEAIFQQRLFSNPIYAEPDIQIQEMADNNDSNIFSDSFFSSGRNARFGENTIFNNCISTDLLKRIDEGSPIKSSMSRRKVSDADEEEEAKDSHSLFYSLKRNKQEPIRNKQSDYSITVNQSGSLSDEEKETQTTGNKPQIKMTEMSGFPTVKNKSSIECSMSYLNNPFCKYNNSMSNPSTVKFNNNQNCCSGINNLTYEEFLRQKYSNQNLNKLYSNYEEESNMSNSTPSNLSKKISPFNEDVAFYPKKFFNSLNSNLKTGNNSDNSYNINNLNSIIYASNSGYGSGNNSVHVNKVPMINPNLVNYNYNSHNPNSNRVNYIEFPRHATTPTYTSNFNILNNLGMSSISTLNNTNNLNNLNLSKHAFPKHIPEFSFSNNSLKSINQNNYLSNHSNYDINQGGINMNVFDSNLLNRNVQEAQGIQGENYNMQFQNINPQYNMNMNSINLLNSFSNSNAQTSSVKDLSPDYLRNPLTLNTNINKIKKNLNLNLNNFVSQNSNLLKDEKIDFVNTNYIPNLNNLNFPTNTENEGKSKNSQGKTGWICSICRNFNYEVRVKCNRCGKPQMKNSTVGTPKSLSSNVVPGNYKLLSNKENVNKLENLQQQLNTKVSNCRELINEQQIVNNLNLMNLHDNDYSQEKSSFNNLDKSENCKEKLEIFNLYDELSNNERITDKENQNTLNKPNSADSKKKKKPFVERVGDWVCIKCKNLNFSFRVICNRCQLTKAESEKLFDQYMKNLMNYVKINELLQNQLNFNQCQNINSQENIISNNLPNNSNSSNYGSNQDSGDEEEYDHKGHNANESQSEYQNLNEFYSG